MILSALRLFRSLSRYHYRTILLTVLLPGIGPPAIAYFAPTLLVLQVLLYVGAFIVWSVLAVLAVASMLRRDRSEAEQLITQQIGALPGRIRKLEEELQDLKVDLWQEVDNLEKAVRSTFEELEVVLPPRPISVRPKPVRFSFNVSAANVTVVRGSKLAHLRWWFRRATRRLWEMVYGKPEDN